MSATTGNWRRSVVVISSNCAATCSASGWAKIGSPRHVRPFAIEVDLDALADANDERQLAASP
jgi:hypothetical protein